jgi:hypothetical protein
MHPELPSQVTENAKTWKLLTLDTDAKTIVANAIQKLSKYDSAVEPFSILCNY